MFLIPKPSKPLKVLTLSGGGLQAVSTLLILNRLLCTIQTTNNAARKPKPCDVFDVICGIGSGGWLALLLGRFQMDIQTCLSEWYDLIRNIEPRTKGQTIRRRLFHNSYFDTETLIKRVDQLADRYGVGAHLVDQEPPDVRCKICFIAATHAERNDYSIFRSYSLPDNTQFHGKFRRGADKPADFKISEAFAVTGATKYFSVSHKVIVAGNGKISFQDRHFPNPHEITTLALDEIWSLFGDNVPLSVVVNIGPGAPSQHDLKQLSRRFSFGRWSPASSPRSSTSSMASMKQPIPATGKEPAPQKSKTRVPSDWVQKERRIEKDIKKKLYDRYKDNDIYHRLALDESPQGTVQNDSKASEAAAEATSSYLERPEVSSDLDSASERLRSSIEVVVQA